MQSLYFLNPKLHASSYLLWLYSPVCVGPGRKSRKPVSHPEAHIQLGKASGEDLDPTEWLNIVEKAITLLGQAFTTTTYHRRMNVLFKLTKAVKKAKSLLKGSSEDLALSQKLFGKKFYKKLVKASTIKKKSK